MGRCGPVTDSLVEVVVIVHDFVVVGAQINGQEDVIPEESIFLDGHDFWQDGGGGREYRR